MSEMCAWYRKENRRELKADNLNPEEVVFDKVNLDENNDNQEDFDSDGSENIFLNSKLFYNFLNDSIMDSDSQDNPNSDPEMQAGSLHHPHSFHFSLDGDDDDKKVVEHNENAGKVISVGLDAHK
ncbi:hypothetical protein SERLA73DRAFT_80013 [Serpula lacrymans var. lacrymans S7.3]|uniref:Uncharacterized protein n=1 Tax=Serpula lacrymans var. lacrymans (strain S7.3) TaxID=936435 RepID=F8QID1_SERL3|nr:hypothetical protein SERLA73DRAFT_80013 [Serpula lacrymans var. lacrymans S7.3]